MKPVLGQNRDSDFTVGNKNKISDGKNFIITDKFSSIKSEDGNILLHSVSGIILGNIPTPDSFVVFSVDGIYSEIGIYKNDKYSTILRTKYLKFNINYPIFGEYEYNQKGELIVVFSDDYNEPKLLNIDDLPFELDYNKELVNANEIVLSNQFVPYKEPIFSLKSVNSGGGNLKSGVYYISLQYRLPDGSYTSNSQLSNPIVIVKSDYANIWENYNGDYKILNTNKSVLVNISNIDNIFKQFKLNIIYKSIDGIKAYTYNLFNIYSNNDILISDIDDKIEIDINSILVPKSVFSNIGTYTKINKRLYLARLKTYKDLKYQKYANNINVNWVYNYQASLDGIKGSYKDSIFIYGNRGFMPGEILALYIRFINKNTNIKTKAFHIAGRFPTADEIAPSTNQEVLSIYSAAKKFQFENTCSIIDSDNGVGKMGYWNNENEHYPTSNIDKDGDFDGSKDYDLNPITNGRNLQGLNVLHHKLPTLNYLATALSNKKIIDLQTDIYGTNFIKFESPLPIANEYNNVFDATFITSSNEGTFSSPNKWVNTTGEIIELHLNYDLHSILNSIDTNSPTLSGYIKIDKIAVDGTITNIDINSLSTNTSQELAIDLVGNQIITVNPGEAIDVYMHNESTGVKNVVSYNGSFTSSYGSTPEVEGNTFGRILAIKLDNIYIPDYVKSDYTHFEILYAKRNANNMTVIANSVLPSRVDFKDSNTLKFDKFYAFDLLQSKMSLAPTHMLLDYHYSSITPVVNQDIVITNISELDAIKKIVKAEYIMNNDSAADPNNAIHEEYIKITYENEIVDFIAASDFLIATMCSFKADVYNSVFNQDLVRTGNLISINENIDINNFVQSGLILGGDTFINEHGITQINKDIDSATNDSTDFVDYMLVPEYSINNIGLRYMTDKIYTLFYPKYNLILNTNNKGTVYNGVVNKNDISGTSYNDIVYTAPNFDSVFTKVVKELGVYDNKDFELFNVEPYYGYNKIYNSLNDLNTILIFNPIYKNVEILNNTIYRTIAQKSESFTLDWHTVLPNEYVISGLDKDSITALDVSGLDLLVEHKFGSFVYKYRGELEINKDVVSELGDADIFKQIPLELIPDGLGYVGCQSKYASIRTKFGNIIVDRSQGKVFIYNGEIKEISNKGLREFFLHNLQYNNDIIINDAYLFDNSDYVLFDNGAAIDVGSDSKVINLDIDNPYGGLGIICAWDEEYERLILTKVSSNNDKFSIDYYPALESWGFRHDFIPTQMFNNRNGLFAILENNILQMNKNTSGTFILDSSNTPVQVKSYLDIVFNKNIIFNKTFKSILWKTILTNNLLHEVDNSRTFDSIIIFNYTRHSNKINLELQTFDSGNVRRTGGIWKFNQFRDILKNKNIEIINKLKLDELQFETIAAENIVDNWYDKSLFIDDFIIVRFIFNNIDASIKLTDIFINSNTIER